MFKNKIIPFVITLFQTEKNAIKPIWFTSIFIAVAVAAPLFNILFEFNPTIKDFSNHVISNASVAGLDISKRVSLFYRAIFIIVFTTVISFVFINKFILQSNNVNKKIFKSLLNISLIGITAVFSGFLIVHIDFSVYIILIMVFYLLAEIRFKKQNQDTNLTVWPILASIPTALFLFSYLKKNNFFEIIKPDFSIKTHVLMIDPQALMFVLFLVPISLVFRYFAIKNKNNPNKLYNASLSLISVPILLSLLLEFFNILNIRIGYVFNSPFLLFLLLLLVSYGLFFIFLKREISFLRTQNSFESYFMPLLIIGFLLMIAQPWRLANLENEFFETANHGLSIDHFFRYGSIPIVENFDAHMLHYQIFAYIYGFLNGYETSASLLYTGYIYVIEIFILFLIFRKLTNSLTSFLLVMTLPILSVVLNQFTMAGLLILVIMKLVNKQTIKNYYYFWFACIFLCLYKLDIGFAALLSGLTTLIFLEYYQNKKINWKPIIKSGIVVFGSMLLLFILICLIKGINPIARLQEFLLAAQSNQNWAVSSMGDMKHFLFRLSYYIFPLAITFILAGIVLKFLFFKNEKIVKNTSKQFALAGFVFFALFYLFNAQRGIVRHNFEYLTIKSISSTLFFALIILMFLLKSKNKLRNGLIVFFFSFLISNTLNADFKNKGTALMRDALNSPSYHEKFLEAQDFKKSRARETFDMSEVKTFKEIIDLLLKPNETYYDFSSKNLYHALIGRKNLSYLNQTPLMINGDKGQEIELEKIKEQNVSIVLMPIKNIIWHGIDGVYVDYKYYKMSEYFYKNYKPLYRMGSFDIYVLKTKYDEFYSKIERGGYLKNKTTITNLEFLTAESIGKTNLQINVNEDKSVNVTGTGENPYFIGFFENFKKQNTVVDLTTPVETQFVLKPFSTGSIKIYYKLEKEEGFSEINTKEFAINSTDEITLKLETSKTPLELMVSFSLTGFQLNEISITNKAQFALYNPERLDYFLGEVPKVWSEYSEKELFNSVAKLPQEIEETDFALEVPNFSTGGYYAFVEIESDADYMANFSFIVSNENKGSYHFEIRPGKHTYCVRVSSNYWWYSSIKDKTIRLNLPKALKISKLCLISEDGKKQISYKYQGISLCNLTDDNWKNGCSTSFNMILLNYSKAKENLLKSSKKIKLIDGSIVTIKGYFVSGNYINVTLNERVANHINALSYPNAIEFVN